MESAAHVWKIVSRWCSCSQGRERWKSVLRDEVNIKTARAGHQPTKHGHEIREKSPRGNIFSCKHPFIFEHISQRTQIDRNQGNLCRRVLPEPGNSSSSRASSWPNGNPATKYRPTLNSSSDAAYNLYFAMFFLFHREL